MDYQVKPKKNTFATASMVLGILSLLSITTVFLPIPLAALSILFAVLAHRKKHPIGFPGFLGILTSCAGFFLSIVMIAVSISMIPAMLKNPTYREQLNTMSEQMYGESFDDMLETIYGVDPDSLFND